MGGFGVSGSPRLLRRGRARTHGKVAPAPDTSRFGREFSTISCVSTRSCEVRRLSTTSLAGILDIFTCALQGSWVGLHPSGFENRHCNVTARVKKTSRANSTQLQVELQFRRGAGDGGLPVPSQDRRLRHIVRRSASRGRSCSSVRRRSCSMRFQRIGRRLGKFKVKWPADGDAPASRGLQILSAGPRCKSQEASISKLISVWFHLSLRVESHLKPRNGSLRVPCSATRRVERGLPLALPGSLGWVGLSLLEVQFRRVVPIRGNAVCRFGLI